MIRLWDDGNPEMLTIFDSQDGSLTLYRMVMPIGTPFLKEKINN